MLAPPVTDETLIAAVARGDRGAFGRLAERLTGPALGLATRVLGDRGHAEDAVQDALVKLWREASRFDATRGPFAAWWRRVLMNAALDGRRRLRPVAAEDARAADDAPDPEAMAQSADGARHVQAAMAGLPARQRAALALFHGDGLSMAEIAETLDTTPKAIEGLLTRARTDMRARLEPLRSHL